jgi:hypothetical protein
MMLVRGIVIDLLTADVGEDSLSIARGFFDKRVHHSKVLRLALCSRNVVKGKAHAENDGALECLSGIGG